MPSNYHNLEVWKLAHNFAIDIKNDLLKDIPQSEEYSLKNQLWRASYSIPMNLVEGTGRKTNKDYASFVYNSFGSAKEVEYCLLLAKDLNYITRDKHEKYAARITQIQKMLSGLIKSLEVEK
ncbi:four helix bundle protein [archaeon]|nr:four helix bundle protein [archaeon]